MSNAYEIGRQFIGQSVANGECAGFIDYIAQQFGFRLWGNGNQIGSANDVSQWADVFPFTDVSQLRVGDIISTDEPGQPYGHTFIYGGGTLDNMLIVEQNYAYNHIVLEHRRAMYSPILRVVRIRGQSNYSPSGSNGSTIGNAKSSGGGIARDFFEITCDKVEGIKSPGDPTVIETFYKCNKVSGKINGDWLIYDKYDGSVAYIPKSCVKKNDSLSTTQSKPADTADKVTGYEVFSDKTEDGIDQSGTQEIYSLAQFISLGRVKYGNYEWTYSSGDNFPSNTVVAGKGYNAYGFLSDGDGNIILSAPKAWGDVMGRSYNTPFGFKGKVYLTNDKTSFDVYVR